MGRGAVGTTISQSSPPRVRPLPHLLVRYGDAEEFKDSAAVAEKMITVGDIM